MAPLSYQLYLDGKRQNSDGDATLTVLNPATEFFGPVGVVIPFDDDEAVRLANESEFGLERGEVGLDEFLLSESIIWSAR